MDISQIAASTNLNSLSSLNGDVGDIGNIDISQFLGNSSDMSAFSNLDMNNIMEGFDMTNIMATGGDASKLDISGIMEKIMAQIQPMIENILKNFLGGAGSANINANSVGENEETIPTISTIPQPTTSTAPQPSTSTSPQPSTSTSPQPSSSTNGEFSDITPAGKGSDSSNQRAVEVRDRLMKDYDLTKEQASGIVGNFYHESDGMKSDVNEYSGGGGFGWAQWTGDRRAKMEQFCAEKGLDPKSAEGNYQFLKYELDNVETGTIPAVKNASTAEEAAIAFESNFERAASPVMEERLKWANSIANM